MRLRDATEADLDFVLAGLAENRALEGVAPGDAEKDRAEYAARISRGTVRIAEEGGRALGFLSYATDFEVMYVSGRPLWIDLVFVHADARGRGLGRALYEEAARLARERGCDRVVADVFAENTGSAAFHERVGFAPLYTIYARPLDP